MRNDEKLILELCKGSTDSLTVRFLINDETLNWRYFLDTISKHKIAAFILDKLMKFQLPQSFRETLCLTTKKKSLKTR